MSEEIELARGDVMAVSHDPAGEIEYAVKCAKALGKVMDQKEKKVVINHKRYLEVDDWTLLGHFFGLSPATDWTRPVEFGSARGWEARAKVVHRSSGAEISAAEAMCLNDEERWAKRPMHQLRSMAQTRAQSKALASCLRWVAQLGGFQGTPAEEVDESTVGQDEPETPRPQAAGGPPTDEHPNEASSAAKDAVTILALKKISSGQTERGAWTLTAVLTSDEKKYIAFDDVLPALTEAYKKKIPVLLVTVPPREKGKDPQIIEVQFVR